MDTPVACDKGDNRPSYVGEIQVSRSSGYRFSDSSLARNFSFSGGFDASRLDLFRASMRKVGIETNAVSIPQAIPARRNKARIFNSGAIQVLVTAACAVLTLLPMLSTQQQQTEGGGDDSALGTVGGSFKNALYFGVAVCIPTSIEFFWDLLREEWMYANQRQYLGRLIILFVVNIIPCAALLGSDLSEKQGVNGGSDLRALVGFNFTRSVLCCGTLFYVLQHDKSSRTLKLPVFIGSTISYAASQTLLLASVFEHQGGITITAIAGVLFWIVTFGVVVCASVSWTISLVNKRKALINGGTGGSSSSKAVGAGGLKSMVPFSASEVSNLLYLISLGTLLVATAAVEFPLVVFETNLSLTALLRSSICPFFYIHAAVVVIVSLVPGSVARRESVRYRDAMLESKKSYVRFISHEIRTPLNVAYLGYKILDDDLSNSDRPEDMERIDTLRDIGVSCEIALSTLNELLNFDKIENQQLKLDVKLIPSLEYFTKCLKPMRTMAKDRGVGFTVDLGATAYVADGESIKRGKNDQLHEFPLHMEDMIEVDQHKITMAIRTLISNAIRQTARTLTVTVRIRCVIQDVQTSSVKASSGSSSKGGGRNGRRFSRVSAISPVLTIGRKEQVVNRSRSGTGSGGGEGGLTAPTNNVDHGRGGGGARLSFLFNLSGSGRKIMDEEGDEDGDDAFKDAADGGENAHKSSSNHLNSGALVRIEVRDMGTGLTAAQQKKLLDEVAHFNPNELQGGEDSTVLGIIVAKGVVDMHGGSMSVFSEGASKGTTYTIDLPLRPVHSLDACHAATAEGIFPLGEINLPNKIIIASRRQMKESSGLLKFEAMCAGGASSPPFNPAGGGPGKGAPAESMSRASAPAAGASRESFLSIVPVPEAAAAAVVGGVVTTVRMKLMRAQQKASENMVISNSSSTVMASSMSSKAAGLVGGGGGGVNLLRGSHSTGVQPSFMLYNTFDSNGRMSMQANSFDPADASSEIGGGVANLVEANPAALARGDSSHPQDVPFTPVLPSPSRLFSGESYRKFDEKSESVADTAAAERTRTISLASNAEQPMAKECQQEAQVSVSSLPLLLVAPLVVPVPVAIVSPRSLSKRKVLDDKSFKSNVLINRVLERVLESEGERGGGGDSGSVLTSSPLSTPKSPMARKELSSVAGEPSLHILVTDDSAMNRKMMVKALTSLGHFCDEAEDGAVAVEKLRAVLQSDQYKEKENDKEKEKPGGISRAASLASSFRLNHSKGGGGGGGGGFAGGTPPTGGTPIPGCSPVVSNDPDMPYYDIVLMDFVMPEMDGPTATHELRSMGYKGPVFGVTGNALPADIDHFLSQGANRVFTKPLNIKAFREAVSVHFASSMA